MEQAKSQLHDTLFVTLRGTSSPLYTAETKKLFEKYGDVKAVRYCPKSPGQKFVEFYDIRDCEHALDKLQGYKFLGGTIDIKYANERKRDPPTQNSGNSGNRRSSRSPSPSPPRRDRDSNRNDRDRDRNGNDRDRDRSPRNGNGGGRAGPQRRQEKERAPVKRHEPYSKSPRNDKAAMNKRDRKSVV